MTKSIGSGTKRNYRSVMITIAGLSVFLLIGCMLLVLGSSGAQLLPSLFPASKESRPHSSGPSTLWSTMLALADQEAAKIDPDAVLGYGGVSANQSGRYDDIAYTGPLTGSLTISFRYARPNGGDFEIEFEDAAPQSTLEKFTRFSGPSETGRANFNPEFGMAYRDALSKVKVSPREAVALTWGEAQAEAQKSGIRGVSLEPLVFFNHYGGIWDISYWLRSPASGTTQGGQRVAPLSTIDMSSIFDLAASNPDMLMGFYVDAVTGQITERNYFKFPAPTPSPSPPRILIPRFHMREQGFEISS